MGNKVKRRNAYFIKQKNKKIIKSFGMSPEPMTEERLLDILSQERKYSKPVYNECPLGEFNDEVYTADEFIDMMDNNEVCNDFGSGYWAKDGLISNDEVFATPRLDATHVVWYNK